MEYKVQLHNLTFYAVIGILEKERKSSQKIIINASFVYEEGFIDYAQAANLIKKHIKTKKFGLLEDALASTAAMLKSHFPQIRSLDLEIIKPHILADVTPSVSLFLKYD